MWNVKEKWIFFVELNGVLKKICDVCLNQKVVWLQQNDFVTKNRQWNLYLFVFCVIFKAEQFKAWTSKKHHQWRLLSISHFGLTFNQHSTFKLLRRNEKECYGIESLLSDISTLLTLSFIFSKFQIPTPSVFIHMHRTQKSTHFISHFPKGQYVKILFSIRKSMSIFLKLNPRKKKLINFVHM